jgi:hypothetical protein
MHKTSLLILTFSLLVNLAGGQSIDSTSLLSFLPRLYPLGYSLATGILKGQQASSQTMINLGWISQSPNYFQDLKFLYCGLGTRNGIFKANALVKDFSLFEINRLSAVHLSSQYNSKTVTDYANFQIGCNIFEHTESGYEQVINNWFRVKADFYYDKRTYPLDTEIYELPPDEWKFQARLTPSIGWTGVSPGPAFYDKNRLDVFNYYRALELGIEAYICLLYQNRLAVYSKFEQKSLEDDLAPSFTKMSAGIYYLTNLGKSQGNKRNEGVEFSLQMAYQQTNWLNTVTSFQNVFFSIKYYGLINPEIDN